MTGRPRLTPRRPTVAPPMLRCWGCRALDRHLERPPGLAHAHAVLADNRSRHRRPRDCRDSSCLKSGSTLLADQSTRHKAARFGPICRPRINRNEPICFSRHLYRARNLVERFFNKIKQCRRVAMCYDNLAANYLVFVQLASIRLWLRANESTA